MKILLLPIWLLGVCMSVTGVFFAADKAHDTNAAAWIALAIMASLMAGPFVLFVAYDKERTRRMEIERRWKRSLEKEAGKL